MKDMLVHHLLIVGRNKQVWSAQERLCRLMLFEQSAIKETPNVLSSALCYQDEHIKLRLPLASSACSSLQLHVCYEQHVASVKKYVDLTVPDADWRRCASLHTAGNLLQ